MEDDVSLRQLKVLSLLLEVGSLTRAAQILDVSQPTVSKILARLRAHFGDPLLVRVGAAMSPTPKALELTQPLRALLTASDTLRASTQSFDPKTSPREFTILLNEIGMIQFIPPLIRRLEAAGSGLSLRAIPLDPRPIGPRLEAGEADLALGFLPEAAQTLRRQHLYDDGYLSAVRGDHPRLKAVATAKGFWSERHVMMTTVNAGHAANRALGDILSARLKPEQVQVRLPSFMIGAHVAAVTDAVATLPARLALALAPGLGLSLFEPPFEIEPIQIDQFWHERVQHDEGHRWLRSLIFQMVGAPSRA